MISEQVLKYLNDTILGKATSRSPLSTSGKMGYSDCATIGIDDGLRCDKWCAMMYLRLRLHWELMLEDGRILLKNSF